MSRILVISNYAESLVGMRRPLLAAMIERGHALHVAAPDIACRVEVVAELEGMGISVHEVRMSRVGTSPMADMRTLVGFWRLMRRIRPAVFFGYTVKPVVYGLLAARLAHVPRRFALVNGRGYVFSGGKGAHSVLRWVIRRLYVVALRQADTVFFQNRDDEAYFRSTGLLHRDGVSIVVNGSGVDLNEYSERPLPSGMHFILIARLLGQKGVREFVEAARQLGGRYPETTFTIAGWLDDNPDCIAQEELDEWTSTGLVEYLGRLQDVRPAIAASSVYVLPTYYPEGTPRTILEAMAMGRAIITTDSPGCRETVIHEESGLIVATQSVEELVKAMERLVCAPEMARLMGHRSRLFAEEKYDVRMVNSAMLEGMGL